MHIRSQYIGIPGNLFSARSPCSAWSDYHSIIVLGAVRALDRQELLFYKVGSSSLVASLSAASWWWYVEHDKWKIFRELECTEHYDTYTYRSVLLRTLLPMIYLNFPSLPHVLTVRKRTTSQMDHVCSAEAETSCSRDFLTRYPISLVSKRQVSSNLEPGHQFR
jgi:hypothetical protein